MNVLLLSLLLWAQGIPVQPTQTGTVTGVLRTADGKPAVNERVTAIPQVEFAGDAADSATLSSLAVTDEQGRYTLENIPPGRYYIAAGRLDLQTYYPGTLAMNAGQPVRITPGAKIEGINFTLNATSAGRAVSGFGGNPAFVIPIDIRIENGGKFPISSGGKLASIKLVSVTGTVTSTGAFLPNGVIDLPPGSADYRITFEGLPENYKLKTLKYGNALLSDGILKITAPPPINNIVFVGPNGTFAQALGLVSAGATAQPQLLSIVFEAAPPPVGPGVRVLGRIQGNLKRILYISGAPGTVYADGTFEFRNVPAGRYVITTRDNPPPLVASVVVGSEDLSGVEVSTTPALPYKPSPGSTRTAPSNPAPGVLPLASLHGHVLDVETGMPVTSGTVYIVGDSFAGCPLGTDGKFEFERLLPGNYELEIQGVGYPTFRRAIVVEEQDLDLELKAG